MKPAWTIILGILMCSACSSLPAVKPLPSEATASQFQWENLFPQQKRLFVHSIQAIFAGEKRRAFMGLTWVDPATRDIRCNILTVEGMLLFDAALKDKELAVTHQVPPFDSPHFARGLMQDIQLVFFPPQGEIVARGITDTNVRVRRFQVSKNVVIDLRIPADTPGWSMRKYVNTKLVRSVKAEGSPPTGPKPDIYQPPPFVELTAHGEKMDYTLRMDLLETKKLSTSEGI